MGAPTSTATRSSHILTELLAETPLQPLTPKTVAWGLINHDTTDGEASLTKKITKDTDLGPATTATEGVDFTNSTPLGMDTPITAVPVESAVARFDITTRALRREYPGKSASELYSRVLAGDYMSIFGMLQRQAAKLSMMCWEKAEADVCALLDDASGTVGVTNTDFTVANALQAIFLLEQNEPAHEDFIWALANRQVADIRAQLLSTSSASAASWFKDADANILNHVDDGRTGLKGTFLGLPVYQTSPSVNPKPNGAVDVAGALLCRGQGRTEDAGALRGAHTFVEGHPLEFLLSVDVSARTIMLMALWEYVVVEHTDAHYISIITGAT